MRKLPPHIVWPGIVIALLSMSITMGTITIFAATRDPASFAVVDDYYEKGLRWDEHKAQQTKNKELGWHVEIEIEKPDALGRRTLIVMLRDREGQPIENAVLEASIFHHAAAGRIETLALEPGTVPGQYRAPANMTRQGLWEISLAVSARDEHFTNSRTLDLTW